MIQAVILAAGVGSRLRPLTDDRAKALVSLGGVPLIGHALDALLEAGVKHVIVVTGYGADALEVYLARRFDLTITTVVNPEYAATNTLASFAAVAHLVEGDFLLVDGDLVFEPAVVSRLHGPGTRLAVDPTRLLDAEAVKVAAEGDRIVAVGKCLAPHHRAVGESIGMAKIDAATGERLFVVARRLLDAGLRTLYYEAAFEALIDEGEVFEVADITGLRWVEIDDHADLERATASFLDR